ncbi:hypothetical protein [Amycolatopsis speibonae]|uniref:Uncharacterized protein n=1 Tax=Amycolatopsis speibonae TaxID=1450224 RepID=A0ABV7P9P0_9PSEU
MSWSADTARLALISRTASSARCFGAPIEDHCLPSKNSSGPRNRNLTGDVDVFDSPLIDVHHSSVLYSPFRNTEGEV